MLREFLSKIFPPPLRFGSGAVIDSEGNISGQLDIVAEFPYFPSFPTPGADQRLYLAESVAFVVEVKSDLSRQWGEVEATVKKLRRVHRSYEKEVGECGMYSVSAPVDEWASYARIPIFVVGFVGYSTGHGLLERLRKAPLENRPNGVLVVKTGSYASARTRLSKDGAAGLLTFCMEAASVAAAIGGRPDFSRYLSGGPG